MCLSVFKFTIYCQSAIGIDFFEKKKNETIYTAQFQVGYTTR